ncbi:MAG TPA: FixH family protein [Virgibacillus sp.]|nr:FixH family protein [Virgibacillus sp.]
MINKRWMIGLISVLALLSACGDDEDANQSEELKMLDVDFELPEEADVDETVELKATVTYGDEKVDDADEMEFEYWMENDQDNSTFIDGENNGDGTYTAEVTFDEDGVYELYAHTTARTLHTMPKKSITVGDGSDGDEEANNDDNDKS